MDARRPGIRSSCCLILALRVDRVQCDRRRIGLGGARADVLDRIGRRRDDVTRPDLHLLSPCRNSPVSYQHDRHVQIQPRVVISLAFSDESRLLILALRRPRKLFAITAAQFFNPHPAHS